MSITIEFTTEIDYLFYLYRHFYIKRLQDHEAQIVQFRILSYNINVYALQALHRNV